MATWLPTPAGAGAGELRDVPCLVAEAARRGPELAVRSEALDTEDEALAHFSRRSSSQLFFVLNEAPEAKTKKNTRNRCDGSCLSLTLPTTGLRFRFRV